MNRYRVTYRCNVSNPPRDYQVETLAYSASAAVADVKELAEFDMYPDSRIVKVEKGEHVIKQVIDIEWSDYTAAVAGEI